MTRKNLFLLILILAPAWTACTPARRLDIDLENVGAPIQPTMYGIFFEDINFAADGGLYAELVKNRSSSSRPIRCRAGRPSERSMSGTTARSTAARTMFASATPAIRPNGPAWTMRVSSASASREGSPIGSRSGPASRTAARRNSASSWSIPPPRARTSSYARSP